MSETIESMILSKSSTRRSRQPRILALSSITGTQTISRRWTEREVRLLYRGLDLFGADFSLISNTIPTKTRAQIISKFHKEERKNQRRIECALQKHRERKSSMIEKIIEPGETTDPANTDISMYDRQRPSRKSRNNSFHSAESIDGHIVSAIRTHIFK